MLRYFGHLNVPNIQTILHHSKPVCQFPTTQNGSSFFKYLLKTLPLHAPDFSQQMDVVPINEIEVPEFSSTETQDGHRDE